MQQLPDRDVFWDVDDVELSLVAWVLLRQAAPEGRPACRFDLQEVLLRRVFAPERAVARAGFGSCKSANISFGIAAFLLLTDQQRIERIKKKNKEFKHKTVSEAGKDE